MKLNAGLIVFCLSYRRRGWWKWEKIERCIRTKVIIVDGGDDAVPVIDYTYPDIIGFCNRKDIFTDKQSAENELKKGASNEKETS